MSSFRGLLWFFIAVFVVFAMVALVAFNGISRWIIVAISLGSTGGVYVLHPIADRDLQVALRAFIVVLLTIYTTLVILTQNINISIFSGYLLVLLIATMFLPQAQTIAILMVVAIAMLSGYLLNHYHIHPFSWDIPSELALFMAVLNSTLLIGTLWHHAQNLNATRRDNDALHRTVHTRDLQLKRIIDVLPIYLAVIRPNGQIEQVDGQRFEHFNRSHVGRMIGDVLADEQMAQVWERVSAGETEHVIYREQDTTYEHLFYPAFNQQGQSDRIYLIGRDVTQQIDMMNALQESEQRLLSIYRAMHDVVLVVGSDDCILQVNPSVEEQLGYPAQDLIGRPYTDLLYPDKNYQEEWETNDSLFDTVAFRHRDGTTRPMALRATTMEWAGEPVMLLSLRDMSEQIAQHAEIKAMREREHDYERLQTKARVIDIIDHQQQQPLQRALLTAGMLQRKYDELAPDKLKSYTLRLADQVDRLRQVRDRFMVARNALTGDLMFNPEPVDIVALCEQEVREVIYDATTHDLRLHTDVRQRTALLDERLFVFIIENLLTNAIKYSPAGGIVKIDLTEDAGVYHLHVTDEGIGIPPEAQDTLFELFGRGSNVGDIKGTGIGLALAYSSAKAHDGDLSFSSTVGVGTTFKLTLPIHSP